MKLSEKSRRWLRKYIAIMSAIAVVLLLYLFFGTKTTTATELHSYKVWGKNKGTELYVAGWMWELEKGGPVKAKIMDELQELDECNGTWVGYGVARVGCENGHQYYLEVVE